MTHVRKIVFDLISSGLNDQEIREEVFRKHGITLPLGRIQTYRETYDRLSPDVRVKFVAGKLDLLGNDQ